MLLLLSFFVFDFKFLKHLLVKNELLHIGVFVLYSLLNLLFEHFYMKWLWLDVVILPILEYIQPIIFIIQETVWVLANELDAFLK